MKMAILSSKTRFKRPSGNIHFGKIILVLLLILGQVLVAKYNQSEASGDLYYYDKYTSIYKAFRREQIETDREIQIAGIDPHTPDWTYEDEQWFQQYERYSDYTGLAYRSISWNEELMKWEGIEPVTYSWNNGRNLYIPCYGGFVKPNYNDQIRWTTQDAVRYEDGSTIYYSVWVRKVLGTYYTTYQYSAKYVPDKLIQSNLKGTITQYPTDGRHTDGYWYIRTGPVNANPTLTSSISGGVVSSGNSYFSKVNLG